MNTLDLRGNQCGLGWHHSIPNPPKNPWFQEVGGCWNVVIHRSIIFILPDEETVTYHKLMTSGSISIWTQPAGTGNKILRVYLLLRAWMVWICTLDFSSKLFHMSRSLTISRQAAKHFYPWVPKRSAWPLRDDEAQRDMLWQSWLFNQPMSLVGLRQN